LSRRVISPRSLGKANREEKFLWSRSKGKGGGDCFSRRRLTGPPSVRAKLKGQQNVKKAGPASSGVKGTYANPAQGGEGEER